MKYNSGFMILYLLPAVMFFTGCLSFRSSAIGVEAGAKLMTSPNYEVIGEAEGISSSFRLFWILPVTPESSINEAVDDAIRSRGGDNLIEAVFTSERKVYITGTVNNIYAKGKVIRYINNK